MKPDVVRASLLSDRKLTAAFTLTGLASLALLMLGWHGGPTGLRHYSCIAGGTLLGMSLGLLLVRLRALELPRTDRPCLVEIGLVMACGAFLALLAYRCGMHQFGGFDEGIEIDVAWRLINGQRPYVDFPCTLPVGFYLGAELAFRLFGVYFRSIIAFNSIWTFFSFLWLYALLRTLIQNRLLAFWSALTCVAITTVAVSFWWYNPVTSLSGALYAASVVAVILAPRQWWRWISLCLSLFLLALMKPNVAGMLILSGSVSLFAFRPTRRPVCLASLLALSLWFLAIRIHGSTLQQVITSYLSVASRGITLHQLWDFSASGSMIWPERILTIILLSSLLFPWFAKFRSRPSGSGPGWPITLFGFFCLLSGLLGFIANNDMSIVDFPLLVLAAFLVVAGRLKDIPRLTFSRRWTSYLTILCVWLACTGFSEGVVRNRIKLVRDFFQFTETSEPFTVPLFQGLHAGPLFHSEVDYIEKLNSTRDMSHAFFGDTLQWAYAAFHLQSPKGLPVWWHPGVSFPDGDQTFYIKEWVSRKFSPVLLIGRLYMGDEIRRAISLNYGLRSEENFDNPNKWPPPLEVLVLRQQGGPFLPPLESTNGSFDRLNRSAGFGAGYLVPDYTCLGRVQ